MTTDTAAPAAAPALDQPWILMYHTVADPTDDPYGIAVAPDRLELQLRWLRARGLRGVGVADLLRARTAGDAAGLVGLTFDDGYADFVETALPILARYDCTATVFVLPGRLGGTNEWDAEGPRRALLTGRQIRAAAEAGTEIASHGLFHHRLPGCPDDVLLEETVRSRELLCELTGTAPAGFCYPYGTFDRRAADAVRRAGLLVRLRHRPRRGGRPLRPAPHAHQPGRPGRPAVGEAAAAPGAPSSGARPGPPRRCRM
ncbi:LOW QUALITY PROTEIN: polysaccharide deacetylase, partial [Streptomyces pristinaespiralis ATCC 25486]